MNNQERNANFRTLAQQVEAHNPSRRGHADRVAVYAVAIGHAMGLAETELQLLRVSAVASDAVKLRLPTEVLERRDAWSPEEFDALATARREFTLPFEDTDSTTIEDIVRKQDAHDGPMLSRILHVAIAFDAMTHRQPWKKPMSEGEALDVMRQIPNRFLPEAVDALTTVSPLIHPVADV